MEKEGGANTTCVLLTFEESRVQGRGMCSVMVAT